MLQLVLGPSGSGKTYTLYTRILERARAGKRSILLVPEQFTSSTEGRLYRLLGDELSGFVTSYSFTSLAEALLQRYGGAAVRTLDGAGRAGVIRRLHHISQTADPLLIKADLGIPLSFERHQEKILPSFFFHPVSYLFFQ